MIISEKATIREAMHALDECAKKVLFIVNDEHLVAAISDGDIRRWLLKCGSLEATVDNAANYKPLCIREVEKSTARDFMIAKHIDALPIVDDEMRIIDMVYIYDNPVASTPETTLDLPVVVMAGGLGTRLYPYTKILPKPLIPIGDLPITEHIINRFKAFGCRDFYLVVNHKKNMIKAYFNELDKDYSITYVDEIQPLGTGGGVGLLKGLIDKTFILTNCDTIIEEDFGKIVEEHHKQQNVVTMICSLKDFQIPYGTVEIGENGAIAGLKEKPRMSFFTNTGSYIVEPSVIDMIKPDTVVGFPDIIQQAKDAGENVGVFPISEKAWMDMGQFDSMEEMRKRMGV